jgi:glycosyltransferase involved in cell wall biosynthesis
VLMTDRMPDKMPGGASDRMPFEPMAPRTKVVFRRGLPGGAGLKWWYARQVPRLARKEGGDLVWMTGGVTAGNCGVPQWVWVPERIKRLKPGLGAGLGNAAAVFCFSAGDRRWLDGLAPDLAGKAVVLPPFPGDHIHPLPLTERENIKAGWTQGKDFFLADLTGAGQKELVDLLKSFSIFKKRQRSHIRLVLTGALQRTGKTRELLDTYKYRQDVDWPEGPDGVEKLRGAAYAAVFPFERRGLGIPVLNSWKAGVPAIIAGGGMMEEMAAGSALERTDDAALKRTAPRAALIGTAGDPAGFAAQLMRIYKEEELRNELIGKGFERLEHFSRERFRQVLKEELNKFAKSRL